MPAMSIIESAPSPTSIIAGQVSANDEVSEYYGTKGQYLDFESLNGKLYGRQKEERKLLKAYHRLSSISSTAANLKREPELILVTGPSGSGKSALSQILREPVSTRGGTFISGKFDELKCSEPYEPIFAAFSELADIIVSKGMASIAATREAILEAVGGDAGFLIRMMPGLEAIIGEQDDHSEPTALIKGSQAVQHFFRVMLHYVRAVCSPENPVVLFLDDLQCKNEQSCP